LAVTVSLGCSDDSDARSQPLALSEVSAVQAREIAALQALGYLEGDQPAPARSGVTLHRGGKTSAGFNLYTSEHASRVFLLDMDGNLLHSWEPPVERLRKSPKLTRAKLFDDGELLVLMEGQGLMRIDRDSRVIWRFLGPAHHDLDVLDDGTIYVLTRETAIYPAYNHGRPIRNDFIVIFDPEGNQRAKISLLNALERSMCCSHFLRRNGMFGDIFHSNALEVLDGRLEHKHPAFRRGNVLTSWRSLDAIGIVDVDAEQVVWHMEGPFKGQHSPTALENENLLVFDNFDWRRGEEMSRVIEIDPVDGEIHWQFRSTEAFTFFSTGGGKGTQLKNGNVLITETRRGRVLEVNREGEILWIYLNPARVGPEKKKIARIFEMQRLPADTPMDWIRPQSHPANALTRRDDEG
jgi:hypothetical protein